MLSFKRYGWLCVLGAEAFYVLCYAYGFLLSGNSANLHRSLFEMLPWFTWGTIFGFVVGAADLFVFSWVFAAYMVWMHNSSLARKDNQTN